MLSLIIILIMAWQFYLGYSRGLILQGFYFLGALICLFIAKHFYQDLAQKIALWVPYVNPAQGTQMAFFKSVSLFDLDKVYYAGVAFVGIFCLAYALLRLLGLVLHLAPVYRFDNPKTALLAGLLSVFVSMIFMSMVLSVLATLPLPRIQTLFHQQFLARFLIDKCPLMTALLEKWWITNII
ncbi:MAG: colicin V production protein [Streptococcus pyogenes]|nr:MAG: colicin V production protein [Streptococcus pyogenes]